MSLGNKRREFSRDIALLIVWATEQGYGIAIDDVKAHDGHMPHSKHYEALAADLNLYLEIDGRWVYQTETEAHAEIGAKWKSMGHKWGGDFRRKDGNHYEY